MIRHLIACTLSAMKKPAFTYTICSERVTYYKREIGRLSPAGTQCEALLIETFRQLIAENEHLCERRAVNRHELSL